MGTARQTARLLVSLRGRFAAVLLPLAVMVLGPCVIWVSSDLDSRLAAHDEVEALHRELAGLADDLRGTAPDEHRWQRARRAARSYRASVVAFSNSTSCKRLESDGCSALGRHLARWDDHVAPLIASNGDARAAQELLRAELLELERIADLTAVGLERRAGELHRTGTVVAAVAFVLGAQVAFGVWQVFSRIRRIRTAAGRQAADRELASLARRPDELGELSSALATALEESRSRRELDAQRLALLRTRQRALERCVRSANGWLAGEHGVDAVLDQVARLCGYRQVRVVMAKGGQPPPGGFRLSWRDHALGDLILEEPIAATFAAERERLVGTAVQLVSLAHVAHYLIAVREQYAALARALSCVGSLVVGQTDLDRHLRGLVLFDVASLSLLDEAMQCEQCLIIERGCISRAPVSECHARSVDCAVIHSGGALQACPGIVRRGITHILSIPLHAQARKIGALQLGRREAPFDAAELAAAESIEGLFAPVLERIRLQERLRWLKQSSALLGFARLLAHELNNPLNNVSLLVQTIARRARKLHVPDSERVLLSTAIEALRSEVVWLSSIVDEHLASAGLDGRDSVARCELDVNQLAYDVVEEQMDELRRHGVDVGVSLSNDKAPIVGNRTKLRLLLRHLISNAADSMQSSPVRKLVVATRDAGTHWDVIVNDTGCGIPDPVEIFLPGHTTKSSGAGMGLALSLIIAREHGGRLIARRTGSGSEFVLSLAKQQQALDVI